MKYFYFCIIKTVNYMKNIISFFAVLLILFFVVDSLSAQTTAIEDPGNLTSFRGNNNKTYYFKITGSDQGSVWGGADGVYTDDSRLAKAAVHAGVLNIGQEGVIAVTILAGQSKYTGNTNNGITTAGYGSYSGSYRIVGTDQTVDVISDPGNLSRYRSQNGKTLKFSVMGTNDGSVWGGADGIYTDDSRLGKAAVHAGVLNPGQQGIVTVTILPGQSKYLGDTKNGITTAGYGSFSGSYRIEKLVNKQDILSDPGNLTTYRDKNGSTFKFRVVGTLDGSVWGGENGIYTDDSKLSKAAVHAGVLKPGEQGVITLTILPGQSKYMGSTKNGITTANYGSFSGSYRIDNLIHKDDFLDDPVNLTKYRNNKGNIYKFKVTGTTDGSVWGGADGIYTDDSRLGKAAVHAGLLRVGEQGVVRVRIIEGQSKYTGNTKNGITTAGYGSYMGSFKFE